jgi:hypothetical protein
MYGICGRRKDGDVLNCANNTQVSWNVCFGLTCLPVVFSHEVVHGSFLVYNTPSCFCSERVKGNDNTQWQLQKAPICIDYLLSNCTDALVWIGCMCAACVVALTASYAFTSMSCWQHVLGMSCTVATLQSGQLQCSSHPTHAIR